MKSSPAKGVWHLGFVLWDFCLVLLWGFLCVFWFVLGFFCFVFCLACSFFLCMCLFFACLSCVCLFRFLHEQQMMYESQCPEPELDSRLRQRSRWRLCSASSAAPALCVKTLKLHILVGMEHVWNRKGV